MKANFCTRRTSLNAMREHSSGPASRHLAYLVMLVFHFHFTVARPSGVRSNPRLGNWSNNARRGCHSHGSTRIRSPSILITLNEFACPRPRVEVVVPDDTMIAEYPGIRNRFAD